MKSQNNGDRINVLHSLLSGVAGTTAMTAFSYLVSEKQGRYFKEPEILNDLIYRLFKVDKNVGGRLPGFITHYATGTLFSMVYHLLPKEKEVLRELGKGMLLGLGFGLVGVGIWNAVFKLHPNPPSIHLRDYLGHLIVAHAIFGETLAVTTAVLQTGERHQPTQGNRSQERIVPATASGDVIPPHSDTQKV